MSLPHGTYFWSDAQTLGSFEVLKGIRFLDFDISDSEVNINFVECGFCECKFRGLRSNGHLWGADDYWERCDFESCNFKQMRSPMNTFIECTFSGVNIEGYTPHQTLFESCVFSHGSISGMKPRMIRNSNMINPLLDPSCGQLVFRNCTFEAVGFRECYFEGVVFDRCTFHGATAANCSFDGVASDTTWWQPQQVDPFTVFLISALDLIRRKCGHESAAHKEFENYLIDYGAGRTSSRDFSACLYNNRVPYAETQKVIKDLRKLVTLHPF